MLISSLSFFFVCLEEYICSCRELTGKSGVAGFVHEELLVSASWCLGIKSELLLCSWVISEQVPVTAVNSLLHFLLTVGHTTLDGVHFTRSITDDEGRTIICFSFCDCLDCLVWISSHSNLCNIDIAILHSNLSKALLLYFLTSSCKLGNLSDVGSLGSLSTCVGVDLCIEDEDVYVLLACDDVVETAVTDIVSPSVTTEDPYDFLLR